MKKIFFVLSFLFILSGCGDGIPNVTDPQHPKDFDGNDMKPSAWVAKFCFDKSDDNVKCLAVKKTIRKDSGRGVMPAGY